MELAFVLSVYHFWMGVISSMRLLFKNIAYKWSFQYCTWLYLALQICLAVPNCNWLYLALPWSAMIYLSTDCHMLLKS